jgi:hypothetical protein
MADVGRIPQSQAISIPFRAVLTSDHVSAATGKTIGVTISKNGAGFVNGSAGAQNATEIGNGAYYVVLTAADTGTLGPFAVLCTGGAGTDDVIINAVVVLGTNLGMTALPNVVAAGSGGLYVRGSGAGAINQAANGQIDVNLVTVLSQAVTCAAGVTFGAFLGQSTALLVADANGNVAIKGGVKKDVALSNYAFLMTDSTNHAPATGKTVTCTRSIDGGAFGAGALAAVTEIGNGIYTVNFGAADLNGTVIVLQCTASGCDATFERIITLS